MPAGRGTGGRLPCRHWQGAASRPRQPAPPLLPRLGWAAWKGPLLHLQPAQSALVAPQAAHQRGRLALALALAPGPRQPPRQAAAAAAAGPPREGPGWALPPWAHEPGRRRVAGWTWAGTWAAGRHLRQWWPPPPPGCRCSCSGCRRGCGLRYWGSRGEISWSQLGLAVEGCGLPYHFQAEGVHGCSVALTPPTEQSAATAPPERVSCSGARPEERPGASPCACLLYTVKPLERGGVQCGWREGHKGGLLVHLNPNQIDSAAVEQTAMCV